MFTLHLQSQVGGDQVLRRQYLAHVGNAGALNRRRLATWGAFILLTLAFLAFGLWVHSQVPVPIGTARDTEIYSFDYLGYANTFTDFRFIGYGRFRHPLLGWLLSPVTLFGHRLYAIGETVYWFFLLAFFAAVMALAVMIVYHLTRRVANLSRGEALAVTALFMSFAHVWLLGGMPETYSISMLLALLTLHWAVSGGERLGHDSMTILGERVTVPGLGAKLDAVGWWVLAVLSGGITITQSAKVMLAYFVVRRPNRRIAFAIVGALTAAALLVTGVFALRVWLRTQADATAPGFAAAWHTLADNFTGAGVPVADRLRSAWVFFSEPILLRGENFDVRRITADYGSLWQPVLLALLYAGVLTSAFLNRHTPVVRVLAATFAVDVAIHFVAQWGLLEGQLYAGHWFYALPILLGLLFTRLRGKWRSILAAGLWLLAVTFFALNAQGYFGHDVGIVWPPTGDGR